MPAFSRSFSSRFFAAVGTAALAVALVVAATGGFRFRLGPLRVSAHGVGDALLVAAAAWVIVRLHGRDETASIVAIVARPARRLLSAVTRLPSSITRHAAAVAVVLAAGTAGAGVAYGIFTANATDPSGYVSQAALLTAGRASLTEPLARDASWPNAHATLSPLGYRPARERDAFVPIYPPGLPGVMAAARAVGGEEAGYLAVALLAAVLVLATYALGRRLHSPLAGVVAAALVATSPVVLFHSTHPMSDVPAAAWWTLATAAVLSPRRGSALGGGLAAGLAILTRPNLAPLAAVIAALVLAWPRGSRSSRAAMPPETDRTATRPAGWGVTTWNTVAANARRCATFVATVAGMVGVLLAWQWRTYGSALESSYGNIEGFFAVANIAPNVSGYAGKIARGELPALCLAAGLAAVLAALAFRDRAAAVSGGLPPSVSGSLAASAPSARVRRLIPPALVAAAFAGAVLALYLPYGVYVDWPFLRFLLPAFPAVFALTGALAAEVAAARPALGVPAVIVAVLVAGVYNVEAAEREQVFRLHAYESRYRTAGRYIGASAPSNTVLLTMQHSGSVRYYTGLPIVRWDLLDVDLEVVLAELRARGRRGLLLLEEWEEPLLRARFPRSPLSRLDWPPRADFGTAVRVRLYDPDDQARPGAVYATDRLP
jgi:hypothetical protein